MSRADASGRPLRQFGVLQDITELRQAEDELRASQARLEEAQRVAHLGYWERDLVADRVVLSEESWRIFGIPPHERTTDLPQWRERWLTLIHPEDRSRVLAAVTAALDGGPRYDVEFRIIRPNGEMRVVHSQGDVIRDASGRPCRMFGTQQDITELRQAEQQLRARQDMLDLRRRRHARWRSTGRSASASARTAGRPSSRRCMASSRARSIARTRGGRSSFIPTTGRR